MFKIATAPESRLAMTRIHNAKTSGWIPAFATRRSQAGITGGDRIKPRLSVYPAAVFRSSPG